LSKEIAIVENEFQSLNIEDHSKNSDTFRENIELFEKELNEFSNRENLLKVIKDKKKLKVKQPNNENKKSFKSINKPPVNPVQTYQKFIHKAKTSATPLTTTNQNNLNGNGKNTYNTNNFGNNPIKNKIFDKLYNESKKIKNNSISNFGNELYSTSNMNNNNNNYNKQNNSNNPSYSNCSYNINIRPQSKTQLIKSPKKIHINPNIKEMKNNIIARCGSSSIIFINIREFRN